MSALGFGGLGSALFAGMREFERAEDRETAQKDRELAKKERAEEREYLRQQRQYQAGQQQRTLADQARDDQFREGLAGVRTADQISEAAVGTIEGKDALVLRDDEGNLMPGAVETKPAQTVTRQRNKDDIMADYAEIARKSGKIDQALKFDELAAAESMKRGKALFAQWSASTPDTGNLEEAIKQAAQIYNGDRLPGQVQGYKMNPDGSAVVNIKNTSTGQTVPVTFKNVAELKQTMEGYYSPETLDAHRKSLREAAVKRQEELLKPYTLRPGEKREVMGPNGKVITLGENNTDRVQIGEDAEGRPIYGKPATSRSAGTGGDSDGDGTGGKDKKKGKSPIDLADSAVMDTIKESAQGKALDSTQILRARSTARELVAVATAQRRNLDPIVAAEIAISSELNPDSVHEQYNPQSNQIERVIKRGNDVFTVGVADESLIRTVPPRWKRVSSEFVADLSSSDRATYVKAARGDKAAIEQLQAAVVSGVDKNWAEGFKRANGRAPTQADAQAVINRGLERLQTQIDMTTASGVVEEDKKQRETTARNELMAAAKAAIGTPAQIMALPPGRAAEIYRQYSAQTDGFQREALQLKMQQDRNRMSVGGLSPQL